ncbi:uncharacterized protein LOC109598472 isoform X2 [Aethina tumida]|uniref:uncharacterized protein LOC109598472 isoform X2 n=1 Tax=Aethina tumida TaxID=116153 RepID=UPI00096AE48E|nr:uncharacterized protein LOC109598472 isoform X2 [Aethina tumida]
MDTKGETSELQQLVSSDAENEDSIVQDDNPSEEKLVSPVRSNKISSSGNTSHSSVNRSFHKGSAAVNVGNSRIQYVNEKKNNKDTNKTATARPRNIHKVPDVRHMERALLGLLDDFHSGKLRAFGSGCTMEQMTNIREQQEKLARLHFDLGAAAVPSLNDESLQRQKNNMSQLIRRLEQLSLSIEGLHNNTKK